MELDANTGEVTLVDDSELATAWDVADELRRDADDLRDHLSSQGDRVPVKLNPEQSRLVLAGLLNATRATNYWDTEIQEHARTMIDDCFDASDV